MRHLRRLLPLLLLLSLVAGCAAPVAAPAAPAGGEAAAPAGDMPYAGTTLRFVGANHPWQEAITPLLADQEMDVSFVYWEGAIDVTGVMLSLIHI
mgnify:CR=1 FL=1